MDKENRKNLLLERLENLLKRQDNLSKDINDLRKEIKSLTELQEENHMVSEDIYSQAGEVSPKIEQRKANKIAEAGNSPKVKSNIEKFIGENLINKIGILITIIGVFIGVKYSIGK